MKCHKSSYDCACSHLRFPVKSMVGRRALFFLLISSLASLTASFPWETCTFLPVQDCSCWDPSLPTVTCPHLNLTSIPQGFKDDHSNWPVIHTLDLSHNSILNVQRSSFPHLKVERLFIRNNSQAINFHRNAFSGDISATLKYLSLRNSKLTQEPWQIYRSLTNLETLDLSDNRIKSIRHLHLLPTLKSFSIENNLIEVFDSSHVQPTLHALHISLIVPTTISDLPNTPTLIFLQDLKVSHTHELSIGNDCFGKFNSLKSLSLVYCSLTSEVFTNISRFSLRQISRSLVRLDLTHNQLTFVPRGFFRPLRNLEYVNLSFNSIERIVPSAFPLQSLRSLDLSHNNIMYFSSISLSSQLTELHLDHNQLSYVSEGSVPQSVHVLTLHNNNFKCDCRLQWIVEEARREIQEGQPGMLSINDIMNRPICALWEGTLDRTERTLSQLISSNSYADSSERKSNLCGFYSIS